MLLILLALVIACAVFFVFEYRQRAIFSRRSIPSRNADGTLVKSAQPPTQFLLGNFYDLAKPHEASAQTWMKLYQKYGPAFELSMPWFRWIVCNHPVYMEHFQRTNFANYCKGTQARRMFYQLHRNGLFVADGDVWQRQRRAAVKAFSKKNFEEHIQGVVQKEVETMLALFKNLANTGQAFDFQQVMSRFTLSSMIQLAFHTTEGIESHFTSDPSCLSDDSCQFARAFDKAAELLDGRRRNPLFSLTEWWTGKGKQIQQATDLIYDYMHGIIDKRLRALEQSDGVEEVGVDLLANFMQTTDDREQLAGQCVAIMLAGRDTTAFSTAWLLLEILRPSNQHLKAPARIRHEIQQASISELLAYEQVNDLKYLNAFWNESIRLNTASPSGQLEVQKDDLLPAIPELGIPARVVKAGDHVHWQNYVMSRMPSVWGEDAAVFNPDRWFDEKGHLKTPSPFVFHSWNAGPRLCLGKSLATYEALSVIVAIMSRFEIELVHPDKEYLPLQAMNMGIRDGLLIRVTERNS